MIGDCTKKLLEEIAITKQKIENFSVRVADLPDDLVLFEAESLVKDIKDMIEKKDIVKENLRSEQDVKRC